MSSTIPGTWSTTLSPDLFARQRTISAPRRAPDGRAVAFAQEFDGRTDLFVVDERSWPVQITAQQALAGGSYDWSPDGARFVFASSDGKLWTCPSRGGTPTRLTRGEGRHHSPAFSPNGCWVCFLSDRGDEIDVVVVASDGRVQRVLNRGSDFPLAFSWAPDSQRIVWSAYPNHLMPWDQAVLVVGSASGGEPRVIAGDDRVTYSYPAFSPDGARIACTCDRSGFLNVTTMNADGGEERSLHPDHWEHGEPRWSPDGRTVLYTRNVDGDYHLWLAAEGESPRPVMTDIGRTGSAAWSSDGVAITYLHESPLAPPDVWTVDVRSGRRTQLTFSALGGVDAADLVAPEHVTWTSADGFETHGLLYTPKQTVPGQHGCLVEIHGGPMNQSRPIWNGLLQYFVQRGWVVIQPNYRGTLGYGRAYREALFGEWGRGDLLDNLGGVDLCLERGLIRDDRVVAWGGSAGGYSTLVCLNEAPERFAGGVALFGLYDLYSFGMETHRLERFYVETILGPSADNYALWHRRSPLNFVENVRVPVLLLHGEKDPAAFPAQSETLNREFDRHGVDYEYAYYPGEGHGFRTVATNVDYGLRMDRYLNQKVLRAPFASPLGSLPYPPMPFRTLESI
jgi:dipeptidyl aminopeptidase/acylaminoacyl peptidase